MTGVRKIIVGFLLTLLFCHPISAQFRFDTAEDYALKDGENFPVLAWTGGINSAQYHSMDFNADGLVDLVLFDRTSFKISTYVNVNNQRYQYDKNFEFLFPDDINNWMILADYNCDGKKDIFTNSPFGVKVYLNTSEGAELPKWKVVAEPLFTQGTSTLVNLQINDTDIPAISDIDGDGDLDILAFNFFSASRIDYHQNMSQELYGHCDSLSFVRVDRHWGKLEECNCGEFAFDDTCSEPGENNKSSRVSHVGGKSLLAFDNDGDGDKDILFGDEDCEAMIFFENVGDAQNALFTSFSDQFPNVANPIGFRFFPAAYYEDVNFDGIKDLLISPNTSSNVGDLMNFQQSSYLYINAGSNNNPVFNYLENDFLQNEMLDLGNDARPLFMDFDADNDQDLLLTSYGETRDDGFYSSIWLFENKQIDGKVIFEIADKNFLNFSLLRLKNMQLFLTDVNQDQHPDLIFTGSSASQIISKDIFYILNTATEPGKYEFEVTTVQQLDFSLLFNENPYFQDINMDGWTDILLGKPTGRIEYHINDGANGFTLENNTFYGISDDTFKRNPTINISDLNGDNLDELVITDATGNINIYEDFINHLNAPLAPYQEVIFNEINDELQNANFGKISWTSFADLDFDKIPEMFVGGFQGGGQIFRNLSEKKLPGGPTEGLQLLIYPNPSVVRNTIYVESNANVALSIYNSLGQTIGNNYTIEGNQRIEVDISTLADGVYILKAVGQGGETSARIIIQN